MAATSSLVVLWAVNPDDVPEKTDDGVHEMRTRALGLPPRLRSMLILVDGRRTVADLMSAGAQAGAPEGFLDTLVERGLARLRPSTPAAVAAAPEPVADPRVPADPGARLRAAQKQMTDVVVDTLGVRAVFFTLKVERCFTAQDIEALLPEYQRLLTKARDEAAAQRAVARVRSLLP